MLRLSPQSVFETLTRREFDILRLLNEGLSDREIAQKLVITLGTVKWYNRQIYGKLAVNNRAQVINRAHELGLLEHDFPANAPSTTLPKNNLPAETTQFIGRKRETSAVKHLLQTVRLLTLTGSPGTGKTRLSLRVAAEVLPDFVDGVFFVNLAPVDDAARLALAIAFALRLEEKTTQPIVDTLQDMLSDQELLLILDNYEHLLPSVNLVSDLLAVAPRLKILVTSRESLRLYGEQEYSVPPLELPDAQASGLQALAQSEAVALFVQQARAVKPDFALDDENILDIAKICVRLDGLPLAIELAAAHSKLLNPKGLLKRLTHPFDVLVGGSRNLPARQRTLRETLDWSYNLLGDGEKTLFTRLSIFAGGWTLEAVQAVCGEDLPLDPLEGLESLIDKSLVRQYEIDGEPRFVMLETIREYALEQLQASGAMETLRKQHANYYTELAERVERVIDGVDQRSALDNLEVEHDNFRATLSWSLSSDPEVGLRLIAALGMCWQMRGHLLEGFRWSQRLLQVAPQTRSAVRSKALSSASLLAFHLGHVQQSEAMSREALALARDIGNQTNVAWALYAVGTALIQPRMTADDYDRANAVFDEALSIFRAQNLALGIAKSLTGKGEVARLQANLTLAAALNKESAGLFSQLANTRGAAINLTNLGWVTLRLGDFRQADDYFRQGLNLSRQVRDKIVMLSGVAGLAGVAALSQQPDRAIRLFGAIDTQEKANGNPLCAVDRSDYEFCIASARTQTDPAMFSSLWEEGLSLRLDQAITFALGASHTS